MSERITISLKDSELLEIENLAKSEGSTVRDIINRRIKESKKIDEIESKIVKTNEKIDELKQSILELKQSTFEIKNLVENLKLCLANSLKLVSNQTSFSKDYSSLSLSNVKVPDGTTVENYRSTLEKRSVDFSEKVFKEFFK